ncbi:MAG TPA: hypothetical protein VI300_12980 [Solirubrobacter sp.]
MRATERRDDAGGHRARVAVRVADRHDELPDAQLRRVPQLGGVGGGRVEPQQPEVGERVDADDAGLDVGAVGEGRAHASPAADHVGIGEHEAVRGDDDARARAPARHAQVGHGRPELLRHRDDDTRIGV